METRQTIELTFGGGETFRCEVEPDFVVDVFRGPDALADLTESLQAALQMPRDFPALAQAVIADDRVVLAVDPTTPRLATIVAGVWQVLETVGVAPEHVVIAEPAAERSQDPRAELPDEVRERVHRLQHDPSTDECAYLAATTSGDRIYLARPLTDADVVVSIGCIRFDPVLGFRGTNSAFYPALSNQDAVQRARGQGHIELEPEDSRPLRQIVDEIAWLLGTQFSIQAVAAANDAVGHLLAGSIETVFRDGRELLTQDWLLELEERPDLVVVAVDGDARQCDWTRVGAAIATGRRLVAREGRIVVLSSLTAEPGPGLQILSQAETPVDAIKPLRLEVPDDLIPATQVANAADWARVYLLSGQPADAVEDLFMIPLETEDDARRLIDQSQRCAFVGSAQEVYGRVVG